MRIAQRDTETLVVSEIVAISSPAHIRSFTMTPSAFVDLAALIHHTYVTPFTRAIHNLFAVRVYLGIPHVPGARAAAPS